MIPLKLFISYSSMDMDKVRIVTKHLKNDSHFQVIIIATNRESLKPLAKKVIDGIIESDIVIPILTKNSIYTQWINQEIGFATAINKSIMPLVETSIIDDLKGFIHKQADLPYTFVYHENKGVANRFFRSALSTLILDLESYSKPSQVDLPIKNSQTEFDKSLSIVDKMNTEIQFKKKREAFLKSQDGSDAAKEEVIRLFDDLKTKIEILKKRGVLFGHEEDMNEFSIVYKSHNYSFSINWGAYSPHSTENSVLAVKFWLGYVTLDRNFNPSDRPGLSEKHIYSFTIVKPWTFAWKKKDLKTIVTSSDIVSMCINWIISKIESAELSN